MHVIAGTIILIVIWLNARARLYHNRQYDGARSRSLLLAQWWTCYGSFCSRCSTCCGDPMTRSVLMPLQRTWLLWSAPPPSRYGCVKIGSRGSRSER